MTARARFIRSGVPMAVGLVLLTGGRGRQPASEWQVLRDRAGTCQISIPDGWSMMSGVGLAADAVTKATAAVHTDRRNSWSQLKAVVRQTLKPTRTLEESAGRLRYEYGGQGLHLYVAKRFPAFNCVAQVDVQDPSSASSLQAVAERIVASVDKVH